MALTRREFQIALDRISKLESNVRALDQKIQLLEARLKGDSLTRILKEHEEQEKLRKQREQML